MFSFFQSMARPFRTTYRCYSVSMLPGGERPDVENGGKIILPPSALEHLTRLNVVYPMLFQLTNRKTHRTTHAGVLEFVADEGKCYLPYWMLQNLLCEEGDLVEIESAVLPVAKFSKFQPLSTDFLDITNPKAILENALRNFACLTNGDVIAIRYNDKTYELRVLETRPGNAVSIIECDMDVEFAAPEDYVEPQRHKPESDMETDETHAGDESDEGISFVPFVGAGNRLDGKIMEAITNTVAAPRQRRGVPDYDYEIGTIYFIRTPINNCIASKNSKSFTPFAGSGTTIRASQKKGDT